MIFEFLVCLSPLRKIYLLVTLAAERYSAMMGMYSPLLCDKLEPGDEVKESPDQKKLVMVKIYV